MGNNEKSGGLKWIIIIVLLAGAGRAAFGCQKEGQVKPEFTTAKVGRGDVTQMVTATGTLKPVVNVEVAARFRHHPDALRVFYFRIPR